MDYTVHPGQSIKAAMLKLRPGDSLFIHSGLYREGLGSVDITGLVDKRIGIKFANGAIIRQTVPITNSTYEYDNIYSIPVTAAPGFLVEADEKYWKPISETDVNNGVTITLTRPVPYAKANSLSEVNLHNGTQFYDAAKGKLYFHPFNTTIGLEMMFGSTISFRTAYVDISGLSLEYVQNGCSLYRSQYTSLENYTCHSGGFLQVRASKSTFINMAKISHVIYRGPQFQWTQSGEGRALVVEQDSSSTMISNLYIDTCWNGAAFGGINTIVDTALIHNLPNHGFGVSAQNGRIENVQCFRAQEGLWSTYAGDTKISRCVMEGAIQIGGGSDIAGRESINITFDHNIIFGGGVYVTPLSTGFKADYNRYIAKVFDYRMNKVKVTDFNKIYPTHKVEEHSTMDPRVLVY